MTGFLARARVATVVAAALALLATGVVAGAAGAALIVGEVNDGETSQTVLLNAGTGASFTLKTTNVSTGAAGIFGWSSSTAANATRGVYGRADGPNSYGVYAAQNAAAGSGSALYATSNNNNAIIATAGTTAIIATATGCTGFICLGANGVSGEGYGLGAGVFGSGGFTGVSGSSLFGVFGTGEGDFGVGVYGDAATGNGMEGYGDLSDGFDTNQCADGGGTYCAGGAFEGANGVVGEGEGFVGAGVYAIAGHALAYALLTNGPAYIDGNLTVSGTCTGCAAAVLAENGSNQAISQGQAVTLLGAKVVNGQTMLVVGPARGNDRVLGVADVEMQATAAVANQAARTHEVRNGDGSTRTIRIPAKTVTAQRGGYWEGGTSTAAGKVLRVITSGVVTFAQADTSNGAIGVNDELTVGANGKLSKAAKVKAGDVEFVAPGTSVGYALGALGSGSGTLLVYVAPH